MSEDTRLPYIAKQHLQLVGVATPDEAASSTVARALIHPVTGAVVAYVATDGSLVLPSASVNVSALTGTLPFSKGGSNTTTEAGFRTNAGGIRVEHVNTGTGDSTAALPTFNPDYVGQICIKNYGRLFWGNEAASWRSSLVLSGVLYCDGLRTVTGDSTHTLIVGTATQEIDNVLSLQNKHNVRHSAFRCLDLNGNETGAFGYGNPGANALFANRVYVEAFSSSQDIVIVGASTKRTLTKWEGATGDLVVLSDDGAAELARFDQSADQIICGGPVITANVGSTATNGVRFDAVDGGRVLFYGNNILAGYASGGILNATTLYAGALSAGKTIITPGTTGNATINNPLGVVNFAAGTGTGGLTVTNNQVTANSIVLPVILTNDATAREANVVCSSGSFIIRLDANATAETKVGFIVWN